MHWQIPLGDELHHLRRKRRLTQEEVAKVVRMDIAVLSRLENGKKPRVTFDAILRLAHFYGVTLNDLYHTQETLT